LDVSLSTLLFNLGEIMPGIKLYVGIWLGLVVATIMEVVTRSLPGAASLLALTILSISSAKAIFIALYYQHLRFESWRLAVLPIAAIVGIALLGISAAFSMAMGG
jgi:caa(3)-type oxidase subunit IV